MYSYNPLQVNTLSSSEARRPAALVLFICVLLIPALLMSRLEGDLAAALVYGGVVDSSVTLSILAIASALTFAYLLAVAYGAAASGLSLFRTRIACYDVVSMLGVLRAFARRLIRLGSLLMGGSDTRDCRPRLASALRTPCVSDGRSQLVDCWTSGAARLVLYQ